MFSVAKGRSNTEVTARPPAAIQDSRFKIQEMSWYDAENLCKPQTFFEITETLILVAALVSLARCRNSAKVVCLGKIPYNR